MLPRSMGCRGFGSPGSHVPATNNRTSPTPPTQVPAPTSPLVSPHVGRGSELCRKSLGENPASASYSNLGEVTKPLYPGFLILEPSHWVHPFLPRNPNTRPWHREHRNRESCHCSQDIARMPRKGPVSHFGFQICFSGLILAPLCSPAVRGRGGDRHGRISRASCSE